MLHTDIPTRSEVEALSAVREDGCVSIYLPTTPITSDAEAEQIRFKNLVSAVGEQLEAGNLGRGVASSIVASLEELVDDDEYWQHQANSLAVFANKDRMLTFRLPNKLSEYYSVSNRFHLKPLLRALSTPQSAFVLAIAQGGVRLVELTRELPARTVDVPDMPENAADAVGKASILGKAPAGRLQGDTGRKTHMQNYVRQVDSAIRPILAGQNIPLILAATSPLDSIFRSINSYDGLLAEQIEGNPEKLSDAEINEAARPIIDGLHTKEVDKFNELFGDRRAHGRATTDVAEAARAATFGAVHSLLVDIDAAIPGHLDEETGAVQRSEDASDPETYGVLDEIARRVLEHGGKVTAVRKDELPDGAEYLAAVLRYSL